MKRLWLVAGSGRSGTSMMTRVLGETGFHIPQPEVAADDTNPRGFAEPRWVVDFHGSLLSRAHVRIADADPAAGERADAIATDEVRAGLGAWIGEQFEISDSLVIKDPRLLWFLPLWEEAAGRHGAEVGVVTMLRHPAEVVRSKLSWYAHIRDNDASSLAGWINSMLESEARTRSAPRCYVRFEDLQEDWTRALGQVASELDAPELMEAARAARPSVDALFDRSLHRSKAAWGDLDVFGSLSDLAAAVWDDLDLLVSDPHNRDVQERMSAHRSSYDAMYRQVVEVARTSSLGDVRALQGKVRRLERANAGLERRLAKVRAELKSSRAAQASLRAAVDAASEPQHRYAWVPAHVRRMVPRRVREAVLRRG